MQTMTTDPVLWPTGLAILTLVILAAVLSGAQAALTAASRGKLQALADQGGRGARDAVFLLNDSERMIGALLLGNNLTIILAVALAMAALPPGAGWGGTATVVLGMSALVLIFGEVLPRSVAITFPEAIATRTAPAVRLLVTLLTPFVAVARALVRALLRLAGMRPDPDGAMLALREDILGAIALGHSEGAVEKEDRDRLLGALDLSDRTVDEIMRHRRQIEMIDADRTPDEIITQVLASPHTRLPVFRGSDDNILGVVHAKELLREVDRLARGAEGAAAGIAALDIVKVAMKPYFVPDTTTLDEQMREFLARRTHFALVVDEYGTLEGLITLEDILEEIVGEITDELDVVDKRAGLMDQGDGSWLVDGQMTIRDLNRAMDWRLPDDEANTIAGLVIHEAQMIPNEGQVFSFHGFRFEVVTRRENRIARMRLRRLMS